jgi:hypothetical protein
MQERMKRRLEDAGLGEAERVRLVRHDRGPRGRGSLPEIKKFLAEAMPIFPHTQHLVANMQVRLDGDRATGRIMCHNPQVMDTGGGKRHVFLLGLWYVDEYVRTPKGWRIRSRVEEKSWGLNLPKGLEGLMGD